MKRHILSDLKNVFHSGECVRSATGCHFGAGDNSMSTTGPTATDTWQSRNGKWLIHLRVSLWPCSFCAAEKVSLYLQDVSLLVGSRRKARRARKVITYADELTTFSIFRNFIGTTLRTNNNSRNKWYRGLAAISLRVWKITSGWRVFTLTARCWLLVELWMSHHRNRVPWWFGLFELIKNISVVHLLLWCLIRNHGWLLKLPGRIKRIHQSL